MHERKIMKLKNKKLIFEQVRRTEGIPNPESSNWGDKVPFFTSLPLLMLDYINKWNTMWGVYARTVFIVRHPIDVTISNMNFNSSGRVKGNYNIKGLMNYQTTVVPLLVKELKQINSVLVVSYESLVTRPFAVLKKIFSFCGLDSSTEIVNKVCLNQNIKWGKINSSRAFMHRWKRTEYDSDIIESQYYAYEGLRKLNYVL